MPTKFKKMNFIEKLFCLSDWLGPKRLVWTRLTALIISVTFVFPYLTWAFESNTFQSTSGFFFNKQFIEIPQKLATIIKSHSSGNQLIVHIQDLHCNYEIQKNISEIIGQLVRKNGLNLVGIEGASQAVNVTKLSTFPVDEVKKEVGDYYMREGKISGAEFYAATGEKNINLVGIENQARYQASRESVMAFLNHESQGYVWDLRESLNKLKATLYNRELRHFDGQTTAFLKREISLWKYCSFLKKYQSRIPQWKSDFPQLRRYLSVSGRRASRDIDPDKLYGEIEQLDKRLRNKFYTRSEQRQLDNLLHKLRIIEKLLNISATPLELAEYRKNPGSFRVSEFIEFIKQITPGEACPLEAGIHQLNAYLAKVEVFYQLADERSRDFVVNLSASMEQHGTPIAALISGGYHTPEILEELRQKNISFVSIKPRLKNLDVINPYFTLLKQRQTPLEKLLAQNQNILALEAFFAAFADPQAIIPRCQLPEKYRIGYDLMEMTIKLDYIHYLREKGIAGLENLETEYAQGIADYRAGHGMLEPDIKNAVITNQGMLIPFVKPAPSSESAGTTEFFATLAPKTQNQYFPFSSLHTIALNDCEMAFYENEHWQTISENIKPDRKLAASPEMIRVRLFQALIPSVLFMNGAAILAAASVPNWLPGVLPQRLKLSLAKLSAFFFRNPEGLFSYLAGSPDKPGHAVRIKPFFPAILSIVFVLSIFDLSKSESVTKQEVQNQKAPEPTRIYPLAQEVAKKTEDSLSLPFWPRLLSKLTGKPETWVKQKLDSKFGRSIVIPFIELWGLPGFALLLGHFLGWGIFAYLVAGALFALLHFGRPPPGEPRHVSSLPLLVRTAAATIINYLSITLSIFTFQNLQTTGITWLNELNSVLGSLAYTLALAGVLHGLYNLFMSKKYRLGLTAKVPEKEVEDLKTTVVPEDIAERPQALLARLRQNPIKLVVADHDDTLTIRGTLPKDEIIQGITTLMNYEVAFADVSGRDMGYLENWIGKKMKAALVSMPEEIRKRFKLVAESGGLVGEIKDDKIVIDVGESKIISDEVKELIYQEIYEILSSQGINPEENIIIKNEELSRTDRKKGARKSALVVEFAENEEKVMGKVYAEIEELLKKLKNENKIPKRLKLTHSARAIDITMTQKDEFVKDLIDQLGIGPEEVLVVGDAPNDFGMMSIPGVTALYVGEDLTICPDYAYIPERQGPDGVVWVFKQLIAIIENENKAGKTSFENKVSRRQVIADEIAIEITGAGEYILIIEGPLTSNSYLLSDVKSSRLDRWPQNVILCDEKGNEIFNFRKIGKNEIKLFGTKKIQLEENQKLIVFPNANQEERFEIVEKESLKIKPVDGKPKKGPGIFEKALSLSAPDSVVPDDKGDLYEEIKKIFRDLHPRWQSYENFLFKQKGKSALPNEGYHSYEHGLEVAYLVWLAVKDKYSDTQVLESLVAASLHDFDPREPLEAPKVARTLKQLASNQALRESLEELGVNIEVVSLLIERSDHPWDEEKNRHFEEKLKNIPDLEIRNSIQKRAELLQLLDKCSAYFFLKPEDAYKRVRALYIQEKRMKVSPDRIIKDTLKFFDEIKEQPLFIQVMKEMPDWARNNWEENYQYYSSISERKSDKKSIFTLGFLPPAAGLILGLTSILNTSGFEQWMYGGIAVLSGLGLIYSCYRLPDVINYFKPAESPYALKDLREDLRKLQGYHVKIPDDWRLWINAETEEIPDDVIQIRFNSLKISPWRLLFLFGRSSYYTPQTNTFAFHENLKSLPGNRRLAVVAHELGHYYWTRTQKSIVIFARKLPFLSGIIQELMSLKAEKSVQLYEPAYFDNNPDYMPKKASRLFLKQGIRILDLTNSGDNGLIYSAVNHENEKILVKINREGKTLNNYVFEKYLENLSGDIIPNLIFPVKFGVMKLRERRIDYQIIKSLPDTKTLADLWIAYRKRPQIDRDIIIEILPKLYSQLMNTMAYMHFKDSGHADLSNWNNILMSGDIFYLIDPDVTWNSDTAKEFDVKSLKHIFETICQEIGIIDSIYTMINEDINKLERLTFHDSEQYENLQNDIQKTADHIKLKNSFAICLPEMPKRKKDQNEPGETDDRGNQYVLIDGKDYRPFGQIIKNINQIYYQLKGADVFPDDFVTDVSQAHVPDIHLKIFCNSILKLYADPKLLPQVEALKNVSGGEIYSRIKLLASAAEDFGKNLRQYANKTADFKKDEIQASAANFRQQVIECLAYKYVIPELSEDELGREAKTAVGNFITQLEAIKKKYNLELEERGVFDNVPAYYAAQEFHAHLQSLEAAGKTLPDRIVIQFWGIGDAVYVRSFLDYFQAFDKQNNTRYYEKLFCILGDVSRKMLQDAKQSPYLAKHISRLDFVNLDAAGNLPFKKEGPSMLIDMRELWDDLATEIVEKQDGEYYQVLGRIKLPKTAQIQKQDKTPVSLKEFQDQYWGNGEKLAQLDPAFMENIAWDEKLIEIDIQRHAYGDFILEFTRDMHDCRVPINQGAINNLRGAIRTINKDGYIKSIDYGFRDAKGMEALLETQRVIRKFGGNITAFVNFALLKYLADKNKNIDAVVREEGEYLNAVIKNTGEHEKLIQRSKFRAMVSVSSLYLALMPETAWLHEISELEENVKIQEKAKPYQDSFKRAKSDSDKQAVFIEFIQELERESLVPEGIAGEAILASLIRLRIKDSPKPVNVYSNAVDLPEVLLLAYNFFINDFMFSEAEKSSNWIKTGRLKQRLEKHSGLTTEAVERLFEKMYATYAASGAKPLGSEVFCMKVYPSHNPAAVKPTGSQAISSVTDSSPAAVIATSPQDKGRSPVAGEMREQQTLQIKGYSFNQRLLEMPWRLLQRWRAPRQSLMIILFSGFMFFHKIVQYFSKNSDKEYDLTAIQPLLDQMKRQSFPRDGLESQSFSPEQIKSAGFKQGNLRDLIFGRYIPGESELTMLDFYEPLLTAMGRTSFPTEKTGVRFAIQTRAILAKLLVRQILVYRSADYYHLTSENIIRDGVKTALLKYSIILPDIVQRILHRKIQPSDPAGYLNEIRKRIVRTIPQETARSEFARELADPQSAVFKAYLNLASRPSPKTMARFTKEFGKILWNRDKTLRIYDLLYFSELMKQMEFKGITIATWDSGEAPQIIALPIELFDGPGSGLAIEEILQTIPRLKLNENWKKRIPRQRHRLSLLQAA